MTKPNYVGTHCNWEAIWIQQNNSRTTWYKVLVNKNLQQRNTQGIHGVPIWYIWTVMEHHRCYASYTPNTREEIHAYVVDFLPHHLIMPGSSTAEQSTKASNELIQVLKNPWPKTPFTIGENQFHAIYRLAKCFNNTQPQKPQKPNKKWLLEKCRRLNHRGCQLQYQHQGRLW